MEWCEKEWSLKEIKRIEKDGEGNVEMERKIELEGKEIKEEKKKIKDERLDMVKKVVRSEDWLYKRKKCVGNEVKKNIL